MQKRLTGLNARLTPLDNDPEKPNEMATIREVLLMIGNVKTETADNARRVRRIINRLRDKTLDDVVLESDDLNYIQKEFERNAVNLTGWAQGQMLDLLDSAEKVEPVKA